MVENVLIDSNFYIGRLRQREDPFLELAQSAGREFDFYTCGAVILEVCREIRDEATMNRFRRAFSVMNCVPTTPRVWEMASDLGLQMKLLGITMQATDLIIAASALAVDAAVLTADSDFHRIPGLTVWEDLPEF